MSTGNDKVAGGDQVKIFTRKPKEGEGVPLNEMYFDDILTGPHEVYKSELLKAWNKAGRPSCQVVGPQGNVLRFRTEQDLIKFLSMLSQSWEYLSPGGYGGSAEISRQRTYQKTFEEGTIMAAEVFEGGRQGSRFIIYKSDRKPGDLRPGRPI